VLANPVRHPDCRPSVKKRNRSHTHTPTGNNTPDTDTHTTKTTPQTPKTNTSHKHLTTLEGGATTVRATSHAVENISQSWGVEGALKSVAKLHSYKRSLVVTTPLLAHGHYACAPISCTTQSGSHLKKNVQVDRVNLIYTYTYIDR